MEFHDVVHTRRSCRAFKADPVPREKLERIVEAATWAPSGKNRQNWRIFVVTGPKRDELVRVADRSFPYLEPSLKKLYDEKVVAFTRKFFQDLGGAPVLLVFYSAPTEEGEFVDTQSVAAAIQNALLAAVNEGLAGCWMTNPVHLEAEASRVLGVEGQKLIAFVPIGFPAKEAPVPPRKGERVNWIGF